MKQHELGTSAADIIRKLGIAEATLYRWKQQYGCLEPSQARELKQLVADLSLDQVLLQDIAQRKVVRVAQRQAAVHHLQNRYSVSTRRACQVAGLAESVYYYKFKGDTLLALRQGIRDLARSRIRYGYKGFTSY